MRKKKKTSETYESILDIWYDSLDGGSARRKVTTYTGQHNTEKRGHTSMPRAGFEPTIPVFEWSNTVRALDRVAIRTAMLYISTRNLVCSEVK
jgi:hypothetical protein